MLVADRQPEFTRLVALSLGREGFRVESAHDGVSALDKVSELNPDLLLLGVDLPESSGLEAMTSSNVVPGFGVVGAGAATVVVDGAVVVAATVVVVASAVGAGVAVGGREVAGATVVVGTVVGAATEEAGATTVVVVEGAAVVVVAETSWAIGCALIGGAGSTGAAGPEVGATDCFAGSG